MTSSELMSPWPEEAAESARGFELDIPKTPRGGDEFARLTAAHRLLQDRLAGAALPAQVSVAITAQLDALSAELAAFQVGEHDRHDGWRPDLPGRGHLLLPPFVIDEESEKVIRGRVTFTRLYLGGNGAAHGGAQPLMFDDLFGKIANHHQAGVARTAYLKVNYRQITPLDVELGFLASLDRIEGRKRWVTGELTDAAGTVLSDAEGLFLQLMPGQP